VPGVKELLQAAPWFAAQGKLGATAALL